MTIYQRIQELAKRRKISIRELESSLKFSNGTLNKWKSSAPSNKLSKVAEFLDTTPDYLILGVVDQTGDKPKRRVDLKDMMDDEDTIMSYEGRPIPDEDMEIIKRIFGSK